MAAANQFSDTDCEVVSVNDGAKKKKLKLPGSKTSDVVMEALSNRCPDTFKRHSQFEVFCLECKVVVNIRKGGSKDAVKHASTAKHTRNAASNKTQATLPFLGLQNQALVKPIEAEVKLLQLLASKNISFLSCAEIASGLQHFCPDSKIAKNIRCGPTKSAEITKCIGTHYERQVIELVKSKPFTIMIDESNDTTDKVLAILASMYDEKEKCNVTKFLQLIKCHDASAEGIFQLIDSFFSSQDIGWSNVVGFESDNCIVMKGKHKGVIKLVKDKNPNIVDLGCICHLCNLCVKKAASALPFAVDDLLIDIYFHFENSLPKTEALKSYFNDYPELNYQRMLKHCSTRWLSLRPCLDRLILFYEPVMRYFIDCKQADIRGKARNIRDILTDPATKPILLFLSDALKTVDKYNVLFQNEAFLFDKAYEATLDLIKDLLARILPPASIRGHLRANLSELDVTTVLDTSQFDVGTACRIQLESLYDDDTSTEPKVMNAIKDWILMFFEKLRKSFPVDLLRAFSVLDPKTVTTNTHVIQDFTMLCKLIGAPIEENLSRQLRLLLCDELCTNDQLKCIQYWSAVGQKFDAIERVVPFIFAFPNSNAATERLFSLLGAVHTPVRNRLALTTINSIMHIKVNKVTSCFTIDDEKILTKACKTATMEYNRSHSSNK